MTVLNRAHQELFRRGEDERYESLDALEAYCRTQKENAIESWERPQEILPTSDMTLCLGADGGEFSLNHWSFSQLCKLCGLSKDTLNKLSTKTASKAIGETLPTGDKPLQLLTTDQEVRSIHGVAYSRLWNCDLVEAIREAAPDFRPPQKAINGGTGLYAGEQDMFLFATDPTGWIEIEGEAFAPGLFAWNSEVGCRSVGLQSFWYQKICGNHLVWDAVEVVEFKRRHTGKITATLDEIRRLTEHLVTQRDTRRDSFAEVIRRAAQQRLGDNAEEALKVLGKHGIQRKLAEEAVKVAERQGGLTIFAVVDALTRLSQSIRYAADRTQADIQASALLALAV